jgi:hypothetical protein
MRKKTPAKRHFLMVCLPYCLQRTGDGPWIALNRALKSICIQGENYALNESSLAMRFKDFPPGIEAALRAGTSRPDQIFLWTSVTDPRQSPELLQEYLAKLALLTPITVMAN